MDTVFLPRFTMRLDACDEFEKIIGTHKKIAIFYGEKAWKASKEKVLKGAKIASFDILTCCCYGKKATEENIATLHSLIEGKQVDAIIAVGGGNCIDTVKVVADDFDLPMYSVASIASTCAAVTKISILYEESGAFKTIKSLKKPPVHCFIDPTIIVQAPAQYLWAGIGDTMAKHVESTFSAKGDTLDYASELGIKIGENCFYPLLRDGEKALNDALANIVSEELKRTILNILITTGSVSLSVDPAYNSALSHALFYGLTIRKHIEEEHLHGEVVSYGTLVQLIMDEQFDLLRKAIAFHKQIKLPICLHDLGLDIHENLDDVLCAAEANKELEHVPYPVTKAKIFEAMQALETFIMEENI